MFRRVLVIDDNEFIRSALSQVFAHEQDLEVCGEASDGGEAVAKVQQLKPDVVVMDLSMPIINGIEAVRVLKTIMPTLPIVIFSDYSDVFSENEARPAGVY